MPNRRSEIHMHSTFSDGEFSPEQLVNIAKESDVTLYRLPTTILLKVFLGFYDRQNH